VIFVSQNREWASAEKLRGKNIKIFRVAISARTARHKPAAIQLLKSDNRTSHVLELYLSALRVNQELAQHATLTDQPMLRCNSLEGAFIMTSDRKWLILDWFNIPAQKKTNSSSVRTMSCEDRFSLQGLRAVGNPTCI
jgi:hypothetical protein